MLLCAHSRLAFRVQVPTTFYTQKIKNLLQHSLQLIIIYMIHTLYYYFSVEFPRILVLLRILYVQLNRCFAQVN